MQNIYLIGMMGAGKTSTGQALARLLKMDFVDLDDEIEASTRLTINEIFAEKGEPFFRAEEKKALRRVALETQTVVATGGGIVLNPENVAQMKQTGRLIYLAASFEALWERVRDKRDRPLISVPDPRGTFLKLFEKRRPLYEASATGRIMTDGLKPEAVAQKIAGEFLKISRP